MDKNRTERLVMLCNVEDAARIKAAADEARMTVSTFMLTASLEKAERVLRTAQVWKNLMEQEE